MDNVSVSPNANTTYTLEVIDLTDGFVDYDVVNVNVNEYFITSISPNPANNSVTVAYECPNATTAQILIVNTNNSYPIQTYSINPAQGQTTIDVSAYPTGTYSVLLSCNNYITDAKNLIITH